MSLETVGPVCVRRGCQCPTWKDSLCVRCWRLAHMFGKDARMFAYEPLDGYRSRRDAVELPWERWEEEARAGGRGVVDLFAGTLTTPPTPARPTPDGS